MECNIFSVNNGFLDVAAVLPSSSIVYELKYRETGSFQAVFPRTAITESAIKIGRFANIMVSPQSTLMYIHTVKFTDTEIWAYGYEAKELLNKCAMLGTGEEPPAGEASSATMLDDAIEALYNYSWAGTTAEISGISGNIDPAGIEYYSLLDFILTICEENKAGLMIYRASRKGVVKIYAGTDVSASVVFSKSFGTLREYDTSDSDIDYVNKVIAIGTDNVLVTDTEPNISGETYSLTIDLREEFPRDEEEMTVTQYTNAVRERAYFQRISQARTHAINVGDIDTRDYGNTYTLGDIVGVYDDSTQNVIKYRVSAVKFTLEKNALKTQIKLEGI